MIQKFIKEGQENNIECHIIPDNKMRIPQNLILEVFRANRLILLNWDLSANLNLIQIEEPSICEAFLDFWEYLIEKDVAWSVEKTMEYVEKL